MPELTGALHDPNEGVRDRIVTALGKKGAGDAIPYLLALLPQEAGSVAKSVITALTEIGFREIWICFLHFRVTTMVSGTRQ